MRIAIQSPTISVCKQSNHVLQGWPQYTDLVFFSQGVTQRASDSSAGKGAAEYEANDIFNELVALWAVAKRV